MVYYRLLGSGVTGANGIAVMNKNASGESIEHSYTGSGRGELDIIASLDNPIESGSIQSDTFALIDATFKDIGTSTDYGTWTSTDFTGTKIERNEEYTTLIPEDTWDTQNKTITGDDLCIEFDINLTYSGDFYPLRFMKNGSNVTSVSISELGLVSGQWYHIKFSIVGNQLNILVDTTTKTPKSLSNTLDTFRIMLDNTKATNMKYKNFVIYPI